MHKLDGSSISCMVGEAIDRYFTTFEDEGAGAGIKCSDGTEALWGMFLINSLEGFLIVR